MRVGLGRAAVAVGIVVASLASGPAVGTAAAASGSCAKAQSGPGAFYPGNAASAVYESLFAKGFSIPHLSTHVPQGIATWENWNGKGQDILVIGMYRKVGESQKNSYLVAMDPESGEHIGTVEVSGGHLGGIAIAGEYLFGQDQDLPTPKSEPVRRYRLSKLEDTFEEAQRKGTRPYLGREKGLQFLRGAGYMYSYDDEVWAGHYNDDHVDKVYRYRVDSKGKLVQNGSGYEAPPRTQGILVTADRLIFSVGNGEGLGKIVVATRHHELSDARQRCFAAPSMSENFARVGNRVFLVYEAGSYRYPGATNRIENVHVVDLSELRAR